MEDNSYRKLLVYEKSKFLVIDIYQITKNYPKSELFGLVSQMRRCAVSVTANIVEGWARRNKKERLQFYCISRASLTELEFYIDLSLDLKLIDSGIYNTLSIKQKEVAKLLNGLVKSQELKVKSSF